MSKEQCVICMEPLSRDIGMTDCKHKFCKKCILKWVNECSECPLCRSQISKIKFFRDFFYSGEEVKVDFKKQRIPDDDDLSLFIDDNQILYENNENFEMSIDEPAPIMPSSGTTWQNGHRMSTRRHETEKPYAKVLETISRQINNSRKIKERKEIPEKVFNALVKTAQSYVMDGTVSSAIAHDCVMSLCDEEKGKDGYDDDENIAQLTQELRGRLIRASLISSNDVEAPKKIRRRLTPLSSPSVPF